MCDFVDFADIAKKLGEVLIVMQKASGLVGSLANP